MSVAAVEDLRGCCGLIEVLEGQDVGTSQIGDVDVVAYAGAVGRGVVSAEDVHGRAYAEGSLGGDFEQVGGLGCGLTGSLLEIGAGDVEITKGHVFEGCGSSEVLEHPLGHEFGASVGIDGGRGRLFGDGRFVGDAINGGSG